MGMSEDIAVNVLKCLRRKKGASEMKSGNTYVLGGGKKNNCAAAICKSGGTALSLG